MKRIYLSKKGRKYKGYFTLVDDEDYKWLNKHSWHLGGRRYVCTNAKRKCGKRKTIKMHRLILGLKEFDGICGDHKNGNRLDNRRCNLRMCTRAQNSQNRKIHRNKDIKYKGVYWHKTKNKWLVQINCNRKCYYVGYFNNIKEAASAYNKKAIKFFNEFARLNEV